MSFPARELLARIEAVREWSEILWENEGEWTGKVENWTRKKVLAREIFVSCRFSAERTLISASVAPHCGDKNDKSMRDSFCMCVR